MDAALAIDRVMTPSEQQLFLKAFTSNNPHWQGAHVADVLDELDNTDAYCGLVDELVTQYAGSITDKRLTAIAIVACVYLYGGENGVTWDRVTELAGRVKQ